MLTRENQLFKSCTKNIARGYAVGGRLARFFVLLLLLVAPIHSAAQLTNNDVRPMMTLWSVPRFGIRAVSQWSDGTINLFAEDSEGAKSFFIGTTELGPGRAVPIAIANPVSGRYLHLVEGTDEILWIGGVRNTRRSAFGSLLSEAYLAKLDRRGRVLSEHEYGHGHEAEVQGLAPLPDGGVAVVGKRDDDTWLARISPDGQVVWEKTFGIGKIASVANVNDQIVVAAFDADDQTTSKLRRARVAVWRFDRAGILLDHRIIREESAHLPYCLCYMSVLASPDNHTAYVFSAWLDEPSPKSLSVAKIDDKSEVLWRKELPNSIFQDRYGDSLRTLDFMVLTNGDPLIASSERDNVVFSRLDSRTGVEDRFLSPTPLQQNCDGRSDMKSMVQKSDKLIWIFGYNEACTWLARISLD